MKEETKLHVEEDEKHLLLDHNYDGIQELNHPLPSWWQFTFYGAILFSTAYFAYYQFLGGPSLKDEFTKDYAVIAAIQEEFKQREQAFNPDLYKHFSSPENLRKGEEVFVNNCVACHLEKGKGDIGPNLTDNYWINAKGTPETIYPVVFHGVVENGMPNWSEVLSRDEIYQVVAYVQTLHNSNLPGAKAPQGNKIDE
jgi:cytochrome c oxidase cbb3-type subunit 3